MLALALVAQALPCTPGESAPTALDDAIHAADLAIQALDPTSLQWASAGVEQAVRCRTAPVTVQQAAHVHRIQGVVAFVAGDEAASALWFGASRALNPAAPLGHTIGGPLESAWDRALPSSPPARSPLPEPREGTLRIDGQILDSRPSHLPYVAQLEAGGALALSALQRPGTVPDYPFRGPDPDEPERRPRGITVAAGGAALVSAGLLGGAAWTRARYRDPDLAQEKADALVPVNRALGVGGLAFAGISLGLGGVAVVREW